jgi:alkanesulfonate monooxygenase
LIVRPTETEAWDDAGELLSMADVVVKEQRASVVVAPQSVNNPEPVAVFGDQDMENYRLDRHLWNGISTVRVNCGTALVGTPEQVAGELLRYWRMGIDEFILSGFPHVEECRRISHDLLPILKNLIHQEKKKV